MNKPIWNKPELCVIAGDTVSAKNYDAIENNTVENGSHKGSGPSGDGHP